MIRHKRFALVAVALSALFVAQPPPTSAEVVGGQPATKPYRFMASLQDAESQSHFCGASLIRKTWVLTAAHCVSGSEPEELQVMLGSHDLNQPGEVITIDEVFVHETYEADGTHDIALLKLTKPSRQRPIRVVSLPERALWEPGVDATAIGWGNDAFIVGSSPDELHEVQVPIVDDETCGRNYTGQGFDPETMVCAGEDTGGRDTCQGDSGGPLMVPDANGKLVVMGTVSWGLGCAFPLFYGVYGRVGDQALRPWIDQTISAN